jgi:hypothetical protein
MEVLKVFKKEKKIVNNPPCDKAAINRSLVSRMEKKAE